MFITFEGGEGTGKTTQIRYFKQSLDRVDCRVTREPGGTALGREIRAILLDPLNRGMDPKTELLLYMADRAQHIAEIIGPFLKSGRIVLCDRFFDSARVYQGVARKLDMSFVEHLHRFVFAGLKPDFTILLDLDPEIGLQRKLKQEQNKGGGHSEKEARFEREPLTFHRELREGYLELARKEPERWFVVDASLEEKEVARRIWSEFKRRFFR